MNHDRDILLREYVLSAGSADDRRLRETLDQACLDCSQELAEAEADLAAFAFDLAPVAPSTGGRERVLARIRAERAAAVGATSAPRPTASSFAVPPAAGPNRSAPAALPYAPAAAPAPRRRAPYALAAVVLIAACLGLGVITARQDARLEAMARQVQAMAGQVEATAGQVESTSRQVTAVAESQRLTSDQVAAVATTQRGTSEQITAMIERLDRFRQLGDRLREAETRMAQRDRDVQSLQDKLSVLRSYDVVIALAGAAAQPKAEGRLYYAKAQRRWLVTMSNLAAPVEGRCYELWFITPDGRKIASDTFVPTADGMAEILVDVPQGLDVAIAAVTDEPIGGVAVPTGQIHLAGTF